MEGSKGLSRRGTEKGIIKFIKLSMASDIEPRGKRIKTLKTFIGGTVTEKDAWNTARGEFIRHIITQTRINTTTKGMKTSIIRRRTVQKLKGRLTAKKRSRQTVDDVNCSAKSSTQNRGER